MEYSLAKELRDAGYWDERSFYAAKEKVWNESKTDFEWVPVLDHLIEACGDGFGGLIRLRDGTWNAATPVITSEVGYHNPQTECVGSTPTEAVARLWLALNKKV
jgi:hypothetical protein